MRSLVEGADEGGARTQQTWGSCHMSARTRFRTGILAALSATAIAILVPAGASAGLLVANADDCKPQPITHPFGSFLDPFPYTLVEGGSFEPGSTPWKLRGGAAVVAGNESFHVNGAGDSRSLSLPARSSATSPTICVGILHPTLRFFARNKGSLLSPLRVDVHFFDPVGRERKLPIGVVLAGGRWQPTLPYPVLVNLLPLLPGRETPVAFEFVPMLGGKWQIDDVFVDPHRRS
jgi:hypothetical protein